MAFDNPINLVLFDKDDKVLTPVLNPVSIVQNFEAHDFNYIAAMVDIHDAAIRDEVMGRWAAGELIQYQVSGRFGTDTGDLNSIYAYDQGGGEFSFYGRSHKEIMKSVLGFPQPENKNPSTQTQTHKKYSGSALHIVRSVLQDNFVNRIGEKMRFQAGNLGNSFEVDFRFDNIHRHLYEDSFDRGGIDLGNKGNIIFNITRDFAKREYVLTAREPVRHERMIEVQSNLLERWQFTAERAEVDRLIIGGHGEMLDRDFIERSHDELRHRRFPKEGFTENTNPETNVKEPTEAQLLEALGKWADSKLPEYGEKASVVGQLIESDMFYLGNPIQLGDWVRIGIDQSIDLGEQQIEKAIATWTRDDGYSVTLTKPEDTETTEAATLRRVVKILNDISTASRRR